MKNYNKIKAIYFIIFAIIIKVLFFIYFQNLKCPDCFQQGIFYTITGDTKDYIEPVDNLVKYGEHRTNRGNYSIRMPGYTPILLFFRLFFNLNWSINLTLFIQVILSGISCYVFALVSFALFNSKKIFLLTYLLYLISSYVSIWDTYILTESLATSTAIFSFYFFIEAKEKQNNYLYLLSGLFLIWCCFLRPFMIPLIILFSATLLYKLKKRNVKSRIISLLFFLAPILIVEGGWVLRNYIIANQLIFTQTRLSYNEENEELSRKLPIKWYIGAFVSSFGGDHTYWNPRGASHWFFNKKSDFNESCFPSQIFNDTLTLSDLHEVKNNCISILSDSLNQEAKLELDMLVKNKLLQFHNTYKSEYPFHYYITSRLIHLKNFILHSGVYNIPLPSYKYQNVIQKTIKSFYAILYLCVFVIGGIYSLCLFFLWFKSPYKLIIVVTPIYLICLFPFIFKVHEYRFNTLAYPFLLIIFILAVIRIFQFISLVAKGDTSRKNLIESLNNRLF